MTEAQFFELLQQTVWMILLLSAPILGTSLLVGVAISILQAVTQIQEATLTFVPKVLVSLLVLVFTGPWMVQTMVSHTGNLFELLIRLGR